MINIFVLNTDASICATLHCDQHVGRGIILVTQLISNALRPVLSCQDRNILYKPVGENDPFSIWARSSRENCIWLYRLARALDVEYRGRFNRNTHHLSFSKVTGMTSLLNCLPNIPVQTFPQCMPEEYKKEGYPVEAYLDYYKYEKLKFGKWKHGVPLMFREEYNKIHGILDENTNSF